MVVCDGEHCTSLYNHIQRETIVAEQCSQPVPLHTPKSICRHLMMKGDLSYIEACRKSSMIALGEVDNKSARMLGTRENLTRESTPTDHSFSLIATPSVELHGCTFTFLSSRTCGEIIVHMWNSASGYAAKRSGNCCFITWCRIGMRADLKPSALAHLTESFCFTAWDCIPDLCTGHALIVTSIIKATIPLVLLCACS